MVARGDRTKEKLLRATVRLVVEQGAEAATIQAIAREAGITEGAIYRHYRSKEELRWQAYKQTVEDMANRKQSLLDTPGSIREKIDAWIQLTYAYFDEYPLAFSYVLLTPQPQIKSEQELEITKRQGRLFMQLMREAASAGEIRDISPQMAMCHFTGLMLNIPRLINEGAIKGPATKHVGQAADAVWRVLSPDGG